MPMPKNISLKDIPKNSRILIVRLSAIGDVIRTLPAVHLLRRELPRAYLGWAVEDLSYNLIKGHPEIDKFFIFPKKQLQQAVKKGNFKEAKGLLNEFGAELKAERFAIAIDMQNLFKSGVVALLSGAKIRVGYGLSREGSTFFLTHRIIPPYKSHHMMQFVDWQLELVKRLGVESGPVQFVLPDYTSEEETVNRFLDEQGIRGDYFCLAPGTSWPNKSWTPAGMAGLADRLSRYGKVLLIGSELDRKIADQVLGLAQTNLVDAIGRFNLRELAVLLRKARFYAGGDTGPMHLAVAVGTQVFAWFGPTSPEVHGPYREGAVVFNLNLPCQPCNKRKCDSKECLLGLDLETVWRKMEQFLKAPGPPGHVKR
ncbi:MAG: glycosyltransferase family 9 protein [Firmicutes bacterium]|nr:glycosyltransferase family 9 protein [Bacillota bacterium]